MLTDKEIEVILQDVPLELAKALTVNAVSIYESYIPKMRTDSEVWLYCLTDIAITMYKLGQESIQDKKTLQN